MNDGERWYVESSDHCTIILMLDYFMSMANLILICLHMPIYVNIRSSFIYCQNIDWLPDLTMILSKMFM